MNSNDEEEDAVLLKCHVLDVIARDFNLHSQNKSFENSFRFACNGPEKRISLMLMADKGGSSVKATIHMLEVKDPASRKNNSIIGMFEGRYKDSKPPPDNHYNLNLVFRAIHGLRDLPQHSLIEFQSAAGVSSAVLIPTTCIPQIWRTTEYTINRESELKDNNVLLMSGTAEENAERRKEEAIKCAEAGGAELIVLDGIFEGS